MPGDDRTANEISGTVNGPVVQATHLTIGGPARDALGEAADRLARAVGTRWQREEEHLRVHDPFPLPVRWHPAPECTTDHWENILGLPPGAVALLHDLTAPDRIADVHRSITSRRLVVLGGEGSGKTVLALRFVLDLLATRGPTDPVPVIFGLNSWNPTTTPLRDWLTTQLLRDHPGLATTATPWPPHWSTSSGRVSITPWPRRICRMCRRVRMPMPRACPSPMASAPPA
ncbi:hypothetical protein [Umezawaea sp. Da 62-37]|uniref:hypothetical protein n=1 Tax=Umezawaea sp. Da 62-37 TaxID=3075927 RepID=UPI0028F6DB08|nr:hypothetical protein [Umezawaea sp. Da 62-37]WNV86783.1 hypothetical protein RM788_00405 [Umezawaea sp. Da 62-37]